MDGTMTIVEELLQDRPKPQLRLLRGGKGPPEDNTPGKDWMSPLETGTVFSCRKKGQAEDYALMMLQIMFKHDKTIIIADAMNNNPYAAVDPAAFCKRHDLFEIIQQGEVNNDPDLRTVRHGGVADDVDAEGRQPEHDPVGPE